MFCPKCGTKIAEGAKFCPACGASLKASTAPTQAAGSETARPVHAAAAAPTALLSTTTVSPSQNAAARANVLATSGVMKPMRSLASIVIPIAVAAALVIGGVAFAAGLFSGGHSSAQALCDGYESAINELYASEFTTDTITSYADKTFNYLPKGAVDALISQEGYSSKEEAIADIFGGSTLSGLSGTESDAWDQALSYINQALSKLEIKVDLYPGSSIDAIGISQIESEFANLGLNYDVQEACWVQGTSTTTALEDYYTMSAGETQTTSWDEVNNCLAVKIDGAWYLWVESDL